MEGIRAVKWKNAVIAAAGILAVAAMYLILGCPIRLLTGVSCPGCGMIRAFLCCLKLDFRGAYTFHPLIFTMPFFAAAFFIFRNNRKAAGTVFAVLCCCLCAVYLWRMIGCISPDVVYFHPDEGVIYQLIRSVFLCLSTKCCLLPREPI